MAETTRGGSGRAGSILQSLFGAVAQLSSSNDDASADRELHLATASLLIHATAVDEEIADVETEAIDTLLTQHFGLSPDETGKLIAAATQKEADAVDLYGFTRVLTKHLGQDGRKAVVKLLWQTVYADGELHPYEKNLVWRVAELLGVSTADRVQIRQQVERGGS